MNGVSVAYGDVPFYQAKWGGTRFQGQFKGFTGLEGEFLGIKLCTGLSIAVGFEGLKARQQIVEGL